MPAASSTVTGPCSSSRRSWAPWPNGLPFQYGPSCDVSLPLHSAGRQLEDYLQKKYSDLKFVATGTLQTALVHCAGSLCYIDPVAQSKRNMDEDHVTLDLLSDSIKGQSGLLRRHLAVQVQRRVDQPPAQEARVRSSRRDGRCRHSQFVPGTRGRYRCCHHEDH